MPGQVYYGDPDLIPIQEAATEYGRSEGTIYNWLKAAENGQLVNAQGHHLKLERNRFAGDKQVYLRRSELERVIREAMRPGASPQQSVNPDQ